MAKKVIHKTSYVLKLGKHQYEMKDLFRQTTLLPEKFQAALAIVRNYRRYASITLKVLIKSVPKADN